MYGAEASGLFAEHGLHMELVAPRRRDAGDAIGPPPAQPDFVLTSVYRHLVERRRMPATPPARFVAVIHQRSPLAAFVAQDSPLRRPAHLAGRRVATSTAPWFDLEYRAGMDLLGLAPTVRVPHHPSGVPLSLADGEVDVIGSWAESVAVIRRRAGIPVRSIPFGPAVYTTGLVAADHVPLDTVRRVVAALAQALRQQRRRPRLGLEELSRRHPGVDTASALEEWSVLDEYVFDGDRPGSMDATRWWMTLEHAARTHGFHRHSVDQVCREELLPAPARAAAR